LQFRQGAVEQSLDVLRESISENKGGESIDVNNVIDESD
jgi:hypothetical protein